MSAAASDPAPSAHGAAASQGVPPWWSWAVAAVAIFLTAISGVLVAPVGTTVAVWWPAAGLSVLFALLQPRSRIPLALVLVLVVTGAANLAAGRPLPVAVAFGAANAIEVAVVVGILGSARRRFELRSLRAGIRFAGAVVAGALTIGVLAAATVQLLEGGEFGETLVFVAASHAAAVCIIAPLAALPVAVPAPAGRAEMAVQAVLLTLVIVLVFNPASSLPLAFAPFPMLAWAALRFPIRFVLIETIVAALVMVALMLDGGGPFAHSGIGLLVGAAMFELLLVTFAGFSVVLSAAQYELRVLADQLDTTNRLLTGSVIDARIGLVVAERRQDATRVRWANLASRQLLVEELSDEQWSGPLRTAALGALRTGEQVTVGLDQGRTIIVAAYPFEGEDDRMTVELLDVTAILQARRAKVEAELEQEAARSIRAELERQRDHFLVTTSHELRTPITSIVGYAELLTESGSLTATEHGWVRVIARNGHRLSELVEDLLTLGRGEHAPSMQIRPEALPCSVLFDEIADNLHVVAEERGLTILCEPGDHVVFASHSDASRMLSNLLVNACKFTPREGRIRLSAHADGSRVLLAVADTGPGMSEAEIGQAFDRFYRAPAAERDSVSGTGLGLAIVAELARRNDGSVSLRQGDGGGLTAELRLPAARSTSTRS